MRARAPLARVIVADPPWSFGDGLPGPKRSARKHYRVMSAEDICAFPLPPHDPRGTVLFMWKVSAMQEEAFRVVRAWGFVPKSEVVWVKLPAGRLAKDVVVVKGTPMIWVANNMVRPRRGMGRYVRLAHESCVIAVKGSTKVVAAMLKRRDVPSVMFAERGRHSAKPEAFFDVVESLYPGPYVELFARRAREGWTCLGNEVGA